MPSKSDDSNPFLDLAASFLQESMSNQNNGGSGGGLASVAQIIGSLMQPDGSSKSNNGAAQILSSIGSLMANAGAGGNSGGGFDPSIITNVIEMFTAGGDTNDIESGDGKRSKRSSGGQEGIGLETILNIASAFMGNANSVDSQSNGNNAEGLMSLLPMVVQAVNSFSGPEGEKIQAKHKEHAWVLPPLLERIHVIWDHFSNSELAEALWQKSGINTIFKVKLVLYNLR